MGIAVAGVDGTEHGLEEFGFGQRPLELDAVVDDDLGTPITRYARAIAGNSVASMAVARTCSDATAMCCARRTARGQYGQVGVEKTLISTGSARAASDVFVFSERAGSAVEATIMESMRLLNSYPEGIP